MRSECTDRLLILNERHLGRALVRYARHYDGHRPHRALELRPPDPMTGRIPSTPAELASIRSREILGALINEYHAAWPARPSFRTLRAERQLLATQHERLESERYKLMEAYHANTIDVTMLRREQERIGAELRAIESRQGVLDGSLDDWQDVMDLAVRFSTRCATAYLVASPSSGPTAQVYVGATAMNCFKRLEKPSSQEARRPALVAPQRAEVLPLLGGGFAWWETRC